MRTLATSIVLLLALTAMAVAAAHPQNPIKSAEQHGKKAASTAADATKKAADEGYDKTKEGAEKAYGVAKDAVTGTSSEEQDQRGADPQAEGAERATTANQPRAKTGELPQTGSPLPVFTLLGSCALFVGAWKITSSRR